MKLTTKMIMGILLLSACAPQPETGLANQDPQAFEKVIYGSDGRQDIYQVTDPRLKQLADSTVALIKNSDLTVSGTSVNISGSNFGKQMNLCPTEKFREQDTAAFCSGSLVAADQVLTAGHCIEKLIDCQSTSLVFGFAVKSVGVLPKKVSVTNVYKCKSIVKTFRDNAGADFAIIKLDRAVKDHAALALRASGEISLADKLVVIGHPVGLPLKITIGGTVRNISMSGFFQANVDTYGGNSGSAVINSATGVVEGVLVRGEQDFENRGNCVISKVCAEGACRGEDVTRISAVRPFLAKAK